MVAYKGPLSTDLRVNRAAVLAQFQHWFGPYGDGLIEVGWINPKTGKITEFKRFDVGDFDLAAEFAGEVNAVPGQSVFFRPALLRGECGRFTTDADFLAAPGIWVDLDAEGAAANAHKITPPMRPTCAVITGLSPWPRAQLYWQAADLITDPETLRDLNHSIASLLNGDTKVSNPTTLMRVAGSIAWPWKQGRVLELTEFRPYYGRPPLPVEALIRGVLKKPKMDIEGHLNLGSRINADKLIAEVRAGKEWHNNVMRLVAHWTSKGLTDQDILAKADILTLAGYTVEETRCELSIFITSARKKFNNLDPNADTAGPPTENFIPKTYSPDFDPCSIPQRIWLLPGFLLKGYVSMIFAPPGVGKSIFSIAIAIAVATGRELTHFKIVRQGNVLIINNEDDQNELDRRVIGCCKQFEIKHDELENKIFTISGYGDSFQVAQTSEARTVVAAPFKNRIVAFCKENKISLVIFDPFVSTHNASENDNLAMEKVCSEYRSVAQETGASILAVHHTRKTGGDAEAHAGDSETGRGASSIVGAARVVGTLARMSKESATKLNIDWSTGNRLIRFDHGKNNYAIRDEEATWYEMTSVKLPNGDYVGIPVCFNMSKIVEAAESAKEEEKRAAAQEKLFDIAKNVVRAMTSDSQPQGEVIGAYMNETGLGRSAANDHVGRLPVGRDNSLRIINNRTGNRVWRENIAKGIAPRYVVHKMEES